MKINWSTLLFACTLVFFGHAVAQELQVVTEDWRPYNYQEGNEVLGVSTVIVKQVLAKAEVQHTLRVLSWDFAYRMALTEPNTLIYTLIRIPQREKLFKWIRPLGEGGTTSLYRLKSRGDVTPKTLKEAKNYRVVANINSMDQVWLKANGFTKLESPPKVENSVRMFFKHANVDLIAFDDTVIEEEFKKFGFNKADVVKVMPLFKTPPYMAVSLGTSDDMVHKLQNAYDALVREKKIKLVN